MKSVISRLPSSSYLAELQRTSRLPLLVSEAFPPRALLTASYVDTSFRATVHTVSGPVFLPYFIGRFTTVLSHNFGCYIWSQLPKGGLTWLENLPTSFPFYPTRDQKIHLVLPAPMNSLQFLSWIFDFFPFIHSFRIFSIRFSFLRSNIPFRYW